jgi:hypothetical protein
MSLVSVQTEEEGLHVIYARYIGTVFLKILDFSIFCSKGKTIQGPLCASLACPDINCISEVNKSRFKFNKFAAVKNMFFVGEQSGPV